MEVEIFTRWFCSIEEAYTQKATTLFKAANSERSACPQTLQQELKMTRQKLKNLVYSLKWLSFRNASQQMLDMITEMRTVLLGGTQYDLALVP